MLRVYDTLSRGLSTIRPAGAARVGMYTCGPTVYRDAHIGNLRSYMMADWIRRVLELQGVSVRHVKNITDVGHMRQEALERGGDKVIVEALARGMTPQAIASHYTDRFLDQERRLNILPAHVYPKATDHVPDMIAMVEALVSKGHAYAAGGNVYYDVSSFDGYGKLSGNTGEQALQDAVRIDPDPLKRDPRDFTLWKLGEPGRDLVWDSPWGRGFPGWHIECSAMSIRYLGERFDIHTGGVDNVFPHHEGEVAQSEGFVGGPVVTTWVHGQHLLADGVKMAKSAGNSFTLSDIESQGIDPLALRYLCMTARYNTRLNFTFTSLKAAQRGLLRLQDRVWEWGRLPDAPVDEAALGVWEARFLERVNDNLDLPGALALTWDLAHSDLHGRAKLEGALRFDRVLGLGLAEVGSGYGVGREILGAVEHRAGHRRRGEYERADAHREEIASRGFVLRDGTDATAARPKTAWEAHEEAWRSVSSSAEVESLIDEPDEVDFTVGMVAGDHVDDVRRCLGGALREAGGRTVEAIVVDNGSDGRDGRVAGGGGGAGAAPEGGAHGPRARGGRGAQHPAAVEPGPGGRAARHERRDHGRRVRAHRRDAGRPRRGGRGAVRPEEHGPAPLSRVGGRVRRDGRDAGVLLRLQAVVPAGGGPDARELPLLPQPGHRLQLPLQGQGLPDHRRPEAARAPARAPRLERVERGRAGGVEPQELHPLPRQVGRQARPGRRRPRRRLMRDAAHPHRRIMRIAAVYLAASCVAALMAACGAGAEPTPTPVPSVDVGPEAAGRVLVLAMSPDFAADRTVFAGTEHAGVFRSTDGGGTWKQVNEGMYDGNVPALAVSPGFAGTAPCSPGRGRRGCSAPPTAASRGAGRARGCRTATCPTCRPPHASGERWLLTGSNIGGAHVSRDGGESWSSLGLGDSNVLLTAPSPAFDADRTVFAGSGRDGMFRSTDGGNSWEAVNDGLGDTFILSIAVSPGFADDGTIFTGTKWQGIYRSNDGGDSWQGANRGVLSKRSLALAVSPAYADDATLFSGTVSGGIFVTNDGGQSWRRATYQGFSAIDTLAVSPGYAADRTALAGSADGLILRTTDGGETWQELSLSGRSGR